MNKQSDQGLHSLPLFSINLTLLHSEVLAVLSAIGLIRQQVGFFLISNQKMETTSKN